ncbi:MAG: hypothetical protein ACREEC_02570, partial [Thermoplasmata archaeon]
MISPRETVRLLGRLVSSGLVRVRNGVYELDGDRLREIASTLTPAQPADADMLDGLGADEAALATRFFRGRRLVEIPATEG